MYEDLKSFEKGFIERQLKDADKAVAEWPAWMRREAGLLAESPAKPVRRRKAVRASGGSRRKTR